MDWYKTSRTYFEEALTFDQCSKSKEMRIKVCENGICHIFNCWYQKQYGHPLRISIQKVQTDNLVHIDIYVSFCTQFMLNICNVKLQHYGHIRILWRQNIKKSFAHIEPDVSYFRRYTLILYQFFLNFQKNKQNIISTYIWVTKIKLFLNLYRKN